MRMPIGIPIGGMGFAYKDADKDVYKKRGRMSIEEGCFSEGGDPSSSIYASL